MTIRIISRLAGSGRTGYLVEYGTTEQIFNNPREKPTQDYIHGAFS
jgi:phosphate transport system ATP-binding protein